MASTRVQVIIDAVDNASKTIKGFAGSFDQVEKSLSKTGSALIALGAAPTAGLVASTKAAVDFEDALANVKKTTGATESELKDIGKRLLDLSTSSRTSAKELINIATIGGQMGIAAKDVVAFTDAIDKVNVALSDEFSGGAEEVTKQMGTLRNLFSDIKSDNVADDILFIANAVNELGAAGLATGGYMAEASRRIAGVAIPLGMSSGEVLGFSAAMEELGFNVERGSSAVVRTLQTMATNTSGFAEVAGMSLKDFEEMVNTDINGAFLAVLDGINKINPSATEMAQILDDLELSGVGNAELFMKMAGATDLLSEKQKMATDSLGQTNSIMDEFNTKNSTTQAEIDKLKNNFNKLAVEIGSELLPKVNETIIKATEFVKEISKFNEVHPGVISGALQVGTAIGGIGIAMKTASTLMPGFKLALDGLKLSFIGLGNIASLSLGLGTVKTLKDAGAAFSLFGGVAKAGLVSAGKAIATFVATAVPQLATLMIPLLPWIAIIGVIIGVVALLALAWKNNWGDIQGKTAAVIDFLKEKFEQAKEGISSFIEGAKEKFNIFKEAILGIPEAVSGFVENVRQKFEDIKTAIQEKFEAIKTAVGEKVQAIKTAITEAFTWENVLNVLRGFAEFLTRLVITIVKFFTETVPGAILAFVNFIFVTIPQLAINFVTWITEMVTVAYEAILHWATVTVPEAITSFISWLSVEIPKLVANFISWITDMKDRALAAIIKLKDDAIAKIIEMKDNLIQWVKETAQKVVDFIIWMKEHGIEKLIEMKDQAIQKAKDFAEGVKQWVRDLVDNAVKFIQELPGKIEKALEDVREKAVAKAKEIHDGVLGWLGKVKDFFGDIIGKAKEAMSAVSQGIEEGKKKGAFYQTGGVVPGAIGEAVPATVHAGERIIPAGVGADSGGGGVGISFNVYTGMYAGTETEKRNIARDLYAALLQVAQSQNKSVAEMMGG